MDVSKRRYVIDDYAVLSDDVWQKLEDLAGLMVEVLPTAKALAKALSKALSGGVSLSTAMTPDEVTHKERRAAPEPLVFPVPVPQPSEPVPAGK